MMILHVMLCIWLKNQTEVCSCIWTKIKLQYKIHHFIQNIHPTEPNQHNILTHDMNDVFM